ncbi:MAG: phosphatase PAP2 family protein [Nitrospirota bacterium]|nr:phosphatase PAP2 family protein [Nitrospirota bacterium]
MKKNTISDIRPADRLNLGFLSFLALVTAVFYRQVASPLLLITFYSGLILLQALLIRNRKRNGFIKLTYDLLFPIVCILMVFDSLERLVHYINPRDIDPLLIRLDYLLFGGYPTVMLEAIMTPLLTDVLQTAYSSYYFLPVTLGVVLKLKGDDLAFDRSLFLIMLCFYLSYMGYMLMPAIGPRFTLNHLQSRELEGLLITEPLQQLLNRLEGVKRDAFPSGHTAITLTVVYLAWRFEKKLFAVMLPVALALIFSTVYCRYHYVVDVIGGAALTLITIAAGETYYGYRTKNTHR